MAIIFIIFGMHSQLQQTNYSYLQQQMETLQQWIEDLGKRRKTQSLLKLLRAIPTIEELNISGLAQVLSDPDKLSIMGNMIIQVLQKMQEGGVQVENKLLVEQQSNRTLASNLKMEIIHERKKYNAVSDLILPGLQKIARLTSQYNSFVQNSGKIMLAYLQRIGANQIQRNSFQFYQWNLKQMFGNYSGQQINAFNEIGQQYDLLQVKGSIIKRSPKQQGKEKKGLISKNQSRERLRLKSDKSAQKSANKKKSVNKDELSMREIKKQNKTMIIRKKD